MSKAKLYLIPTVIADNTQASVIPDHVRSILPGIRYFLVENVRTARRFLSSLKIYESIEPLHFEVLDKDTTREQLKTMFNPLFEGHNVGVLSESGCPGIADPGALAVAFAHAHGIPVTPLVGPSSIVLALMASGLNGQNFAFHGYLPIDQKELGLKIKEFERESRNKKQSQIFIETPYRNNQLMATLKKNLMDSTMLTVALDLTGPTERVTTLSVKQWKIEVSEFAKVPAVFLFLAS
jgi:16S rRNA (cytidine1402-2'-O)-methyltransferase